MTEYLLSVSSVPTVQKHLYTLCEFKNTCQKSKRAEENDFCVVFSFSKKQFWTLGVNYKERSFRL